MDNPLVSVLVANYNHARYLPEALDSLIGQSYRSIEIIIVDDHSTDGSPGLLKSYAGRDERIQWYSNRRNRGYGYCLRKATALSSGSLLCRLDPDDALDKNAIEIMVKEYRKYPECSMIYSTHYDCDQDLRITGISPSVGPIPENDTYLSLLNNTRNQISHLACFSRSGYDLTKGFNPSYRRAVDKDIYYKLEETGPLRFINEPLYYYRHHSSNISLDAKAIPARIWENRAKMDAWKRRRKGSVKSLPKSEILLDFIVTYRKLVNQSRANARYKDALVYRISHLYYRLRYKLEPGQ